MSAASSLQWWTGTLVLIQLLLNLSYLALGDTFNAAVSAGRKNNLNVLSSTWNPWPDVSFGWGQQPGQRGLKKDSTSTCSWLRVNHVISCGLQLSVIRDDSICRLYNKCRWMGFRLTSCFQKKKIIAMKTYQSSKASMSSTHLKWPGQQSPLLLDTLWQRLVKRLRDSDEKARVLSAKGETHIGYWNVQTLFDTLKLSQVIKEMEDYKLNILGLCEVCWSDFGKFSSEIKMILFSERHDGIHCDCVAIILDKRTSEAHTQLTPINEHLMMTRFVTSHAKVTVI